jgi:hypothetical protein
MRILFAIAVLCFAALVWTAFATVRHIRKNSATGTSSAAERALLGPDL